LLLLQKEGCYGGNKAVTITPMKLWKATFSSRNDIKMFLRENSNEDMGLADLDQVGNQSLVLNGFGCPTFGCFTRVLLG
jgi:hypothetical protein